MIPSSIRSPPTREFTRDSSGDDPFLEQVTPVSSADHARAASFTLDLSAYARIEPVPPK